MREVEEEEEEEEYGYIIVVGYIMLPEQQENGLDKRSEVIVSVNIRCGVYNDVTEQLKSQKVEKHT